MKKLFVGSLPYSVDDAKLAAIFEAYGTVVSAKVILDRERGDRSKGFGFVEMEDEAAADKAIAELHESEYEGRNLIVSVAQDKKPDNRGGGGGYGGGGGRGRDNGGGGYGGGRDRY